MRTIRLDIGYDGTDFYGWQRQRDKITVQETLENMLQKMTGEKVTLFSSSRTDAGVHAKQQVVSFCTSNRRIPIHAFMMGANNMLPKEIRVHDAQEVHERFHANRDAKFKTYRYFIYMNRKPSVFASRYSWHIYSQLRFEQMKQASSYMLGEHDFTSLRTGEAVTKSPVRCIHSIKFGRKSKNIYYIEVSANGFLRHMVRNMVGLLVEVGFGKRSPKDVEKILLARDRKVSGVTAPAKGLFLWSVTY